MADAMVLATQKWLNEKYGNDSRFNKVAEDGITGWGTIYGLRRALQIEEKLPSLSNNFGQSTYAKCPTVKKGDTGNLVYSVQGGLWCKGYSPGGFNGVYGDGTYAAVQRFKKAAGFDDADGNIDKDFMKALLDMSAFKLLSGGTDAIRTIQQQLNKDYYDFYQICPCNGLYDRDMNKMLIYALQKEEGIPKASATGTWGPSTISKCPTLELGKSSNVVKLVRYALVCNGISVSTSSKTYDSTLDAKAKEFAKLLKLNKKSNVIDYTIIKSLLSSNGDPNRSAKGCDTATKLTKAQIQTIKNAGYEYVGRYLSNTPGGTLDKALTKTEVKNILNAGLKLFAIFQETGSSAKNFTSSTGKTNGQKAYDAANELDIIHGSTIYFAVDFDPTDSVIKSNIIPYFESILSSYAARKYKIGVYGTRNVCHKLRNQLGINKFFVSDASYGFSGNLGYIMPDGWCFDQFKTDITIGSDDGKVSIDKVAVSNRDKGIEYTKTDMLNVIMDFVSPFDLCDRVNCSLDYEVDSLTFLKPDTADDRNYITLSVKHGVSFDPDEGVAITNNGEDFSLELDKYLNAGYLKNVDNDTKTKIKWATGKIGYSVTTGNLETSVMSVSDRDNSGVIISYDLTIPETSDEKRYVKISLMFKVCGPIKFDFSMIKVTKKQKLALAGMGLAFAAVILLPGIAIPLGSGLGLTGAEGLATTEIISEGYHSVYTSLGFI